MLLEAPQIDLNNQYKTALKELNWFCLIYLTFYRIIKHFSVGLMNFYFLLNDVHKTISFGTLSYDVLCQKSGIIYHKNLKLNLKS